MLLYIDNIPKIVEPLGVNPYGFTRLRDNYTLNYLATLPAKFIRDQKGTMSYNGHVYRWPDEQLLAHVVNGVIHIEGPHNYARYFSSNGVWRESASVSNSKLKELLIQSKKGKSLI